MGSGNWDLGDLEPHVRSEGIPLRMRRTSDIAEFRGAFLKKISR